MNPQRQKTVLDIIRITARILNTLDWSPSASDQTTTLITNCHNMIFYPLQALHQRQESQQYDPEAFTQRLGISPQRVCTLYQQIAYNTLAPPDLRKSLLPYIASLVLHGFGKEVRSCFMDSNCKNYSPRVQWARNFTQEGYIALKPCDVMFQAALCWLALFSGSDAAHVAVQAISEDDITSCLGEWSLDPGMQAEPVKCAPHLSPSLLFHSIRLNPSDSHAHSEKLHAGCDAPLETPQRHPCDVGHSVLRSLAGISQREALASHGTSCGCRGNVGVDLRCYIERARRSTVHLWQLRYEWGRDAAVFTVQDCAVLLDDVQQIVCPANMASARSNP